LTYNRSNFWEYGWLPFEELTKEASKMPSKKFALVIANTEYTDPGLAQLTSPGRDAREFGRVLDSPDLCAFDDVIILINENASKVGETIDHFFSVRKPDDLLILYFSGHGVRDEYGSLYLAVKNTNRVRLRSTAIKADFVREAMDQSRSRRQVLILDCCNSGAFAQGTKAETGGSIGTAKAFEGTGYGRVVLTASDSTQFAWEGDKVIGKEITNSLFTHFLVKGLEGDADQDWDGKITVDELYDYTYEQVVRRTPKQTPGKWSYRQQGEIFLRENLKPQDVRPVPLPADLLELVAHTNASVRKVGIQELVGLLDGKHLGLARSAQEKLREIAATDDSLTLRQAAGQELMARGFATDNSAPVPVPAQKESLMGKPSSWHREAWSPQKYFSPLVERLKGSSLPRRRMEWKLALPKLEKRLVFGILSTVLGMIVLSGAAMFLINGMPLLARTPTATITPTLRSTATATPSPVITMTPRSSQTISPTPARTRTPTSTLTATQTPTSTFTKTLAPAQPTKRKNDDPDPPLPP
jgi:hypothetical protein